MVFGFSSLSLVETDRFLLRKMRALSWFDQNPQATRIPNEYPRAMLPLEGRPERNTLRPHRHAAVHRDGEMLPLHLLRPRPIVSPPTSLRHRLRAPSQRPHQPVAQKPPLPLSDSEHFRRQPCRLCGRHGLQHRDRQPSARERQSTIMFCPCDKCPRTMRWFCKRRGVEWNDPEFNIVLDRMKKKNRIDKDGRLCGSRFLKVGHADGHRGETTRSMMI
jgi:hypothetical protein